MNVFFFGEFLLIILWRRPSGSRSLSGPTSRNCGKHVLKTRGNNPYRCMYVCTYIYIYKCYIYIPWDSKGYCSYSRSIKHVV